MAFEDFWTSNSGGPGGALRFPGGQYSGFGLNYLSMFLSGTSTSTWTLSFWVKALGAGFPAGGGPTGYVFGSDSDPGVAGCTGCVVATVSCTTGPGGVGSVQVRSDNNNQSTPQFVETVGQNFSAGGPPGQGWYHVCISSNLPSFDIYVNGVIPGYNSYGPGGSYMMFPGPPSTWGAGVSSAFNTYIGLLAEAYVINGRALTPTDFAYNNGGVWSALPGSTVVANINGSGGFGPDGSYLSFEKSNFNPSTNVWTNLSGNVLTSPWTATWNCEVGATPAGSDIISDFPPV